MQQFSGHLNEIQVFADIFERHFGRFEVRLLGPGRGLVIPLTLVPRHLLEMRCQLLLEVSHVTDRCVVLGSEA